jgi:hypothetical protein
MMINQPAKEEMLQMEAEMNRLVESGALVLLIRCPTGVLPLGQLREDNRAKNLNIITMEGDL